MENKVFFQRIDVKVVTASFLIICGYVAQIALSDTIEFGKYYFGKTEKTQISWFLTLYIIMNGIQWLPAYIPAIFTFGWFKDAVTLVVSGVMLISGLNAYNETKFTPFKYLEPEKYNEKSNKKASNSDDVLAYIKTSQVDFKSYT